MKRKLKLRYPTPEEDAAIMRAIAEDPDAAPDLSRPVPGIRFLGRGRPELLIKKKAINIRLDPDLLTYFKSKGPGWQTLINETLRKAVGL